MQANTITFFQLMLHIHSLCTLNYTKHQMTRKQKKLSQLDEGISNAKLEFSFFCYYKQNLADLIFLNTGLENLKPVWHRTCPYAPSTKIWGWRGKENHQRIKCFFPASVLWFGLLVILLSQQ